MGGRKPRQADGKVRLALSVSAVLSDPQASATNVIRGARIGVAAGIAVREERQGDHVGIVGGVGGGEQPSEVFIASSPAPVTINARTRPCEGMRMSVRPSCDHVAAQVGTVRADLS